MVPGLEISAAAFAVAFVAVGVGAVVQRLCGQAFGMIASPLIAAIAPQHVPASVLILGFFIGMSAAVFDFSAVERSELPPGFAGRALGAVAAAMLAASLPGEGSIRILVACAVLLGVGLSLVGARVRIAPVSLFSAGLTAGVMGTLTAVGAPPMALLYQHEEARRSRAMQNVFFFWGMIVSLPALAWQGLLTLDDALFSLMLAPAAVLGILVSMPLARLTERRRIRPVALGFSAASALALLAGALL